MTFGVIAGCSSLPSDHQPSASATQAATPAAASKSKPVNPTPAAAAPTKRHQRFKDPNQRFDKPERAAAWWAGLHEAPAGQTAAELNDRALVDIKERVRARQATGSTVENFRWESWGPGNFAGRLRGVVIKPDDTDNILIGSVAGGVWKTTDGGQSWALTDDFLGSLAVGSMIVDPDNPNRVFTGTGEGFFNVDAAQGLGIYVSTDFGDSWTLLGGTSNANFNYVNRLVAIPGTNKLLAATRTGIWGTDDFTAPTPTWTERSGFGVSSRGFVDLKFDPSTSSPAGRVYAVHYGGGDASRLVFRSNNDGASFTALGAAEGVPTTTLGRIELGIGTDGVIYLAVANSSDQTRGLWRSPAGGNAFTLQASTPAFIERQGWYDLINGVKPGDSNTVFVGAVDMYKSTNGGTTITKKTFWNANATQWPNSYVHADLHVVAFDPVTPSTMYIGCDGGLFKSIDSGETWTELNNDVRLTQYYGIAGHPDGKGVIGGTQDNGSHLFYGENKRWLMYNGGDGGFSAWDQQQPNHIYGAFPQGGLFGSNDGGSTTANITLPSTAGALFITPFTLDPNNGNRMIVGTNRVFYSANIRSLASATFIDSTNGVNTTGSVSALAFSPHNGNVAYAGTASGRLYRTTTVATPSNWTQIQDASWLGSDITWIEVDPHDVTGNTLYVTLADYAANRVWKSTNGGSSWVSIHANLPNIPEFSVVVDPKNADRLFLGSELGLWTTDGNSTSSYDWQVYDHEQAGVPFTRVMQLIWSGNDDVLWAGTHGRSIYKGFRSPAIVTVGAPQNIEGCDADSFLDGFETAEIDVTVENGGGLTMTNVEVEILDGVQISSPTAATAYGNLTPGDSATETFTIQVGDVQQCRALFNMSVEVSYDGGSTVHVEQLYVGANESATTLVEDAEDADTAFTHEGRVAGDDWARVSTSAATGTFSWFSSDIGGFCDRSLVSPWLLVGPSGDLGVEFALRYITEGDPSQFWDGLLLELRTEGGEWVDLGNLSSVPYDGPLFHNNTAPGRDAWSGNQATWRTATVNAGSGYANQRVQIRWRNVCDESTGATGVWVDDIEISNVTWPTCDNGCSFRDGFETGNTSRWFATVPPI